MNFKNIENLLHTQNISWENLNKTLKENNADQTTIDQAYTIFQNIDKNNDKTINKDEWKLAEQALGELDTNHDGQISDEEFAKGNNDNLFKKAGSKITNSIINAMGQIKPENKADIELEKDSNGNIITYPKEGETFKKTAERLGFKPGTPEYEEFKKANAEAGKRNWFIVGDEVKIPPSIQDKINQNGLIDKKAGEAEVQKYYNQQTTTSQKKTTGQYPQSIQDRLESLKKSGDKYKISGNAQSGYTISVTSGTYMKKNNIGLIEMKYDANGNLKTYTQKYNNGQVNETTYAGGKKTVTKAKAAPQSIQNVAAEIKKKQGGNVRIEYNDKIKKYVLVQTDLPDKNIKEIRTVIDEKSWQQKESKTGAALQGAKDAWDAWSITSPIDSLKKAKDAAMRNRDSSATPSDYFLSNTVTYADGKVTQGIYSKGKIKITKTIRAGATEEAKPKDPVKAANSATPVPDRVKLHTATDISFNMPEDAPPAAREFANSLTTNKARLMKELGIDSDTYNMLAQTAIGIAKQETNFGESTGRQKVKDILRMPSDSIAWAQQSLDLENKSIGKDWSQGVTQLKYTLHTQDEWVKKHMDNLGITNELQLQDPETSAVATMVVLAKLNKEIDSKAYQEGIKTAQGTSASYPGWEMGEDGIARKSADGATRPWKNEITRQDVLCAFWNGTTRSEVKNGTFKPQVWSYSRNVRQYTQEYKLKETEASRNEAIQKEEETRTFEKMNNNGEMGGIIFLPAMYTDKAKHMNNGNEIKQLREILTQKGIDPNLRNQLISALQNGELGFDFGLRKDEMESLTNSDIKLILKHLNELKSKVNTGSINTTDGISAQEASTLRSKYASTVGEAEDNFRAEYLNTHSGSYTARADNPKVLREQSTNTGSSSYVGANGQRRGFMHEKAKGVNVNTTAGKISDEAALLAQSAHNVVSKNPNNISSGLCLTGVKEAMSAAGIDVSEMIKYGSEPKYVKNWFAAHPEMFTPIEYIATGDGTARSINSSDLANLPAGCIVIWEPESGGSHTDQAGHIAITNGNGQGYADATDNLGWGTYSNNKSDSGKGEHGRFVVYKLSANWEVDPSTGKLVLKS